MNKKAFIVDDDPNIVELFRHILEKENLEVFTALDGDEALEKISVAKPNIIILDLMLPKQGGFEVLKSLQQDEKTKNIPVIIITGKFTDGTTYDFVKSQPNVKDFFSKPINPSVFAVSVKKILGGYDV
ncbi:MAG: response regulator [Elusimicrobiota bacterium]|nr:response regulator [Elusimicrobiota bacterium]